MNLKKNSFLQPLLLIIIGISFWWALQNYELLLDVVSYIYGVFSPFVMGFAIAFILNVPMRWLERMLFGKTQKLKKLHRPISYFIVLILLLGGIYLFLYVIIPEIINTIEIIVSQIPTALDSLEKFYEQNRDGITSLGLQLMELDINYDSIEASLISALNGIATGILNSGVGIISSIVSGVISFVIGFIFSIYVLMKKESLGRQMKLALYAIFPKKFAKKILDVLNLTSETFANFLSGQCMEATIFGVMFFIVLSIFKFPYALLISMLLGITALIPIVGGFIGCIIGAFLILMVNPIQALIFVVIFLVLQQIEGNLIYPVVVGNSVGLPSIWVLVAISVGASLMGVVGMLTFIPLSSVAYTLFRLWAIKRLKNKQLLDVVDNENNVIEKEEV